MTNNDITSNIYIGYFIGGIIFSVVILAVFQIGLNIGIRTVISLLEHEYPAAFKFLEKNKKVAKLYPYVIAAGEKE